MKDDISAEDALAQIALGVVAARHARRVMRYENALSLCAQEVLQ
jgi:hypothetical protein